MTTNDNIWCRFSFKFKRFKKDLEKEWTLEWYIDNLDFGVAMLYTDWFKIKNKVDNIKYKKLK